MIKAGDCDWDLVAELANKLAEHLFYNKSPLSWMEYEDVGNVCDLRPKEFDDIDKDSLCFNALVNKFKKELDINFVYSFNDFSDAFNSAWCRELDLCMY